MTCIDRCVTGSRARIGLAACRSSQIAASSRPCAAARPGRPWRRQLARRRRAPPPAPPLNPPRTRAGAPHRHRAPSTSAPAAPLRTTSRKVRSSSSHDRWPGRGERRDHVGEAGEGRNLHLHRRAECRDRVEPPRDLRHHAERSLGADEEVEQVARVEPGVEGVAGGVLPGVREALADQRGRGPDERVPPRLRSVP